MDYTVSLQVQHQLAVFPTHLYQGYSVELQMKSTEVDQRLLTDSYCKVCSAQLISESQRVAHYESRKHANKVRLYYMLHPVDGGCPAKKLRTDNGSDKGDVDKNKCCTLCNMSFTSAVVAQSHYQGKIHTKRLKLLMGEQPDITNKEASPSPVKSSPETSPMTTLRQRSDSDRYCQLCNAWFNNPGMAQQHYDGKKHKKNAARADLLEQLGKTLDMGEMKGLKRSYTCEVCSVTLNSVAQYHAHLQGSKHQNKLKPAPKPDLGVSVVGWSLPGVRLGYELKNSLAVNVSWATMNNCLKKHSSWIRWASLRSSFEKIGQDLKSLTVYSKQQFGLVGDHSVNGDSMWVMMEKPGRR
ncbi:zinc finger matrin-type protein 4 [Anoplopoma fimbria]|uniref:zinc finger matrin-type protein 4 n=1 Tax=Anoplopoma fimbria TaxID=229290 RepID=UPI0023EDF4F3|nr:zinc finger matrin-type protein 4 [Anoplopoma fimbria]